MCLPRLDEGLKPACVEACPTHAITVEKVDVAAWRADHVAGDAPLLPSCRPDAVDHPHRAAPRRAGGDVRGERLEPAARAPALAAGVADAAHPAGAWASASPPGRRAPAARRRARRGRARRRRCSTSAGRSPPGRRCATCAAPGSAARSPCSRSTPRWPRCSRRHPGGHDASRRRRRRRRVRVGRLYIVPGRPAWYSPLTVVRFFATAAGPRPGPAGHGRLAALGAGVALAATALNWARLARAPPSRGGASVRLTLRWFRTLDASRGPSSRPGSSLAVAGPAAGRLRPPRPPAS